MDTRARHPRLPTCCSRRGENITCSLFGRTTAAARSVERARSGLPQGKSAREGYRKAEKKKKKADFFALTGSRTSECLGLICRELVPGLCSAMPRSNSVFRTLRLLRLTLQQALRKLHLHGNRRRWHPQIRHPQCHHALTLHSWAASRHRVSTCVRSFTPHYHITFCVTTIFTTLKYGKEATFFVLYIYC